MGCTIFMFSIINNVMYFNLQMLIFPFLEGGYLIFSKIYGEFRIAMLVIDFFLVSYHNNGTMLHTHAYILNKYSQNTHLYNNDIREV